jgi:uncharacterized membrane protein (DUF4010 family)
MDIEATPAFHPFFTIAIALAVGLIVGLERGWHERALPEGGRVAGLRTFGLVGFAGGVFAMLAGPHESEILIAGGVLVGAALLLGQWRRMRSEADVGATTMVAAIVTFALGALAVRGKPELAAGGAVMTALLLGLKPRLHALVAGLEERELMAALRLLLISVVALPLLPDRGYGPYGALNPYEIWWFVVLLAGLSFAGYIAIKAFGANKGLLLTGAAGGLFASTAVAISFARLAREKRSTLDTGGRRVVTAGILIAAAIMPLRLLVLVAIVRTPLLEGLLAPLLAMSLAGFVLAWHLARHADGLSAPELTVDNPVDVLSAVRFAALLALMMLLVPALRDWLGESGLYLLAVVSGIVDVDAITLSTARLADGTVTSTTAASVVLAAIAANTVAKCSWVAVIAGGRLASGYALGSLVMLAAAVAGWAIAGSGSSALSVP